MKRQHQKTIRALLASVRGYKKPSVIMARSSAERIVEMLEEESTLANPVNPVYEVDDGSIDFDHVSFSYIGDKDKLALRHMVLHNISLFAKPGQKLAFVGATGAGKTTITNLINRFYDIQKGSITYGGIDIGEIKKEDLRHSLGIVLQDTHLFTGTIMENIRYGKLDASDEEVYAAAALANADSFIRMLPQGY